MYLVLEHDTLLVNGTECTSTCMTSLRYSMIHASILLQSLSEVDLWFHCPHTNSKGPKGQIYKFYSIEIESDPRQGLTVYFTFEGKPCSTQTKNCFYSNRLVVFSFEY